MDNKGHFHFELSFKGHVNKKSTASTPVHAFIACLGHLLPPRYPSGSGVKKGNHSRQRKLGFHGRGAVARGFAASGTIIP